MDEIEKDGVEEVEEISEEKTETEAEDQLYSEEEIHQMALDQHRNDYIVKFKEDFIEILNKTLDYLYDAKDAHELGRIKLPQKEWEDTLSLIDTNELLRKKVQQGLTLTDMEMGKMALASNFVAVYMEQQSKMLLSAATQIKTHINELIKQNID